MDPSSHAAIPAKLRFSRFQSSKLGGDGLSAVMS